MNFALWSGSLERPAGVARTLAWLQEQDVRAWFGAGAPSRPAAMHAGLRGAGVTVAGLGARVDPLRVEELPLIEAAAQMGGCPVVFDLGEVAGPDAGDPKARSPLLEAMLERLAPRLHAALRAGLPVALLYGGGAADWLDAQALEWLHSDLPALALWLAPARAGADTAGFIEGLGPHVRHARGIHASGRASDGALHAHPAEGGVDWRAIAGIAARNTPWVLDLAPHHSGPEVADARRWLQDACGLA